MPMGSACRRQQPMPAQVADGLHFLHTEANQVHRALCPHTVFITAMGAWKLGGLSLACPSFITAETAGVVPVSYRDPSMERFLRWQQVGPPQGHSAHVKTTVACEAGSSLLLSCPPLQQRIRSVPASRRASFH